MDTMTQNTLADLRSMEHAIDDKKDRYLLGLCTLFVATIEDAKDRISQLELVFCCQLFPAFQNKLLESRQALQESEDLHSQALQEWQASREELLREIQELRTDRESRILHLRQELQGLLGEIQARAEEASQCKLELQEQSKLHKLEVGELQQELSRLRRELKVTNPPSEDRLREGPPGNEQGASLQSKLVKLSGEAADLRQENSKLLQENQKFSQLSAELRSLKSKMPSATPTVPDMSSDSKDLQLKLEQKSQERSLECFRRQLLSAEVEKERKATHAALLKLHSLKKRYQSLRKQYTVLFRHSHLSDLQKQAGVSKKQVEPDLDETADERYGWAQTKVQVQKTNTTYHEPSSIRCYRVSCRPAA
ncbi:hypothetical protein GOP47_0025773 [Adiantum capillus-veneris]|uniref:Uncharacterized protein n=1 Tax=Adiantum capillus-veneris TaxID=13818 RepID=A0A9D4Z382_ADICA|nr:hypothetical protein GOP47_0025773 [Adiantum capillus-veneris]